MNLRGRLALAAIATTAAIGIVASGVSAPLPRDVGPSAPPAPSAATGGTDALVAHEGERPSALPSPALRAEIERLGREGRDMARDRRRQIDECGYDAGDVALYDAGLRDLRSSLDSTYSELEARGEATPAERVSRLRDVDVAQNRDDLDASRADRDRYAREGRPSPDYPDELALREAFANADAALLAVSEARLRMAERDALDEGRR